MQPSQAHFRASFTTSSLATREPGHLGARARDCTCLYEDTAATAVRADTARGCPAQAHRRPCTLCSAAETKGDEPDFALSGTCGARSLGRRSRPPPRVAASVVVRVEQALLTMVHKAPSNWRHFLQLAVVLNLAPH